MKYCCSGGGEGGVRERERERDIIDNQEVPGGGR
jgi:hypothetical protein